MFIVEDLRFFQGMKMFVFKEDPSNLAKSRQNLNKMYWVEKGLQVFYYARKNYKKLFLKINCMFNPAPIIDFTFLRWWCSSCSGASFSPGIISLFKYFFVIFINQSARYTNINFVSSCAFFFFLHFIFLFRSESVGRLWNFLFGLMLRFFRLLPLEAEF